MDPRLVCRVTFAASLSLLVSTGFAAAKNDGADLTQDGVETTLSGSYLAGRSADTARDIEAAKRYYMSVLETDSDNPVLVERVLVLMLASGDIAGAEPLADALIKIDIKNPLARLTRGAAALKAQRFEAAQVELGETAAAPLAILTGGLLRAWAQQALGRTDDALATIDSLSGPSWYGIFKDYHTALIADLAGREDKAMAAIRAAYNDDNAALRVVEAYARIMARNGKRDEAVTALDDFLAQQPNHSVIVAALASVKAGENKLMVNNPLEGTAEVLYGLGAAIGTDEGTELPAAYLHLASFLDPSSELASMALGDLLFGAQHCEDAIAAYDTIPPTSILRRNADIQTGLCLDTLDRTDEAAKRITAVIDKDPADLDAVSALGNIYRGRDRFAEAAAVYTRGIDTIKEPSQSDWRIYYFRGVSLERAKRWPEAEADLKKALDLNPNQPQVLNYLGYSWIDRSLNLDQALDMIKTAVDLKPNDGYIVDSLGWAYFQLKRYPDAVEQLERAVELRPEDSTINDHLGDAYWKVGRKREATFQWAHARDLDPEPEAREKIVKKLETGLTADGGKNG